METIRKFFRDLLLATVVLVAFCGVVELGLRAAGKHFEAPFYAPDREFGWTSRPNLQGWDVWENENFVQINSHGMRDAERSLHRDPHVIRIAILGDSITEAKEVPLNQNYCSVLERDLNTRLAGRGLRAEVLNFAIGGYDLAQDYLLIERSVLRFDPQIVILANMTGYAVMRSTRKLYVGAVEYGTPFFTLHDGQLALDGQTFRERASFPPDSKIHRIVVDWTNRIRLLGLLHQGREDLKNKIHEIKAGLIARSASDNPDRKFVAFPELGIYAKVLRVEEGVDQPDSMQKDTDLAEAWQVTEATILKARDLVALHHSQLWLFTLDLAFQVDPEPKTRAALLRRYGVNTFFGADHKLAAFATQSGIPIGVLGPDLVDYAEHHNVALHGFPGMPRNTGHLNATGHNVVGHLMAQKLWEGSPLLHSEANAIASVVRGAVADR